MSEQDKKILRQIAYKAATTEFLIAALNSPAGPTTDQPLGEWVAGFYRDLLSAINSL